MSRYNPQHNLEGLLNAAETWKQRCLLGDGPLLGSGCYWTSANLDELDRCFIQNPQDSGENYFEKLAIQLEGASHDAIKLMAELNWVLLLFSTNIKPDTKRSLVTDIWKLSGDSLPRSRFLDDATLSGAGSTGTGYNTHRWRELVFLIEFMKAFKALTPEDQKKTLANPWEFADWVAGIPKASARQFRHIICFLLFPDSFEHTSVGSDKKAILGALNKTHKTQLKAMGNAEVDKELLALRERLEKENDGILDFHTSPWVEQWRPSQRCWLLAWDPVKWDWTNFQDDRLSIASGEHITLPWRTVSKQLKSGDTVYLMHLGHPPKGLIAKGTVTSEPNERKYNDANKADQDETAMYVDITLTDLRDPKLDDFISITDLQEKTTDGQSWMPQESEIVITPASVKLVANLWEHLSPVKVLQMSEPSSHFQAATIAKPENKIFYGPPGTGKTHHWHTQLKHKYETQGITTNKSGKQENDQSIKRHLTVTFHQSYSYEDFVEGIRPQTGADGGVSYEVRDGLFKAFCKKARKDPLNRYALFIDEINRGNVSRIFGELITLIEGDKRAWWDTEGQLVAGMEVTLPYSGERFGVPKNLDIYATMNTADRSITLMDAALRRRFHFVELIPKPELILGSQDNGCISDGEGGEINLRRLLEAINKRLRYLLHRDQTFGHGYFNEVTDIDGLRNAIVYDIIPMLAEYFYDDWQRIRWVLADDDDAQPKDQIISRDFLKPSELFTNTDIDLPEKSDFQVRQPQDITPDALRKIYDLTSRTP